jgi:two-component system sensor kinase FixL
LEATLRSGRIISSVREMTRKGVSKKGPVEVGPILTEALKLANIGIEHLTVSWDVAPNLIVLADRVQIQQVIINLIRNACDAAGGMPCMINIKASSKGADIEICVSDNGPGIPTEVLAQIFEVFVSTKTGSLGVGLSISRTIVEAHGGHIKAENLSVGGALVCFTLPRICHS